jgi:hypothetical protein
LKQLHVVNSVLNESYITSCCQGQSCYESHQVRDQKAYLYYDVDQGMMVQAVDARQHKRPPQQDGKRDDEQLQFMLAITMADWELMKEVVKGADTKVGVVL